MSKCMDEKSEFELKSDNPGLSGNERLNAAINRELQPLVVKDQKPGCGSCYFWRRCECGCALGYCRQKLPFWVSVYRSRPLIGISGGGNCGAWMPIADAEFARKNVDYAAEVAQGTAHYPHGSGDPCLRCHLESVSASHGVLVDMVDAMLDAWNAWIGWRNDPEEVDKIPAGLKLQIRRLADTLRLGRKSER